ncbi:AI-2E family transporter [Geminocystis sp. NIES-3709]|uniref:AI-2E family transporter n=1 Tax=Geminocystis sp. NIES-3709 TaxID=1617448 RepID=UPI0005FCB96E|nr:AI-2E family transporter [Geminocystis sp. NIES-3709]BAQ65467.1 permease [Geminocystis sp. NIES-3709]
MLEKLGQIPRWLRLVFVFPLLCLNGFLLTLLINYFQPLISFLIIASILAFLLELLIKLLVQKGIRRSLAITFVLFITIFLLVTTSFILLPILTQQLEELLISAPKWIDQANQYLLSELPIFNKFSSINIDSIVQQITGKISEIIKTVGGQTVNILFTTINSVFNVLFIFILTIFLLSGGDKFWVGIFSWFPEPWHEKIPNYLSQTFKDYFFSRLILVSIASVIRGLIFMLLGVPYAILFAFGIGIASLVPILGGVVTLFGTLLLIFKSGQLALFFFISATIIDQLTDNVVAPRFMGELIGLNPVWLIISLFIGAKLGGLLGIFLAVPLASVIKKIIDDLRSPSNYARSSNELSNSEISMET